VFENEASVGMLDGCSFGLTGLRLQGAVCVSNRIQLSTNIVNPFPVAVIKWSKTPDAIVGAKQPSTVAKISLPIYLNATRADLLFTIGMETSHQEKNGDNAFFMRGVAILASNLS
jgi:dynein heavy chain 1